MEKRKVRIFADSTCDLSEELTQQYQIRIIPLCIVLDDKSYYDKLEITPKEIFEWADKNKKTPKTAAITFKWKNGSGKEVSGEFRKGFDALCKRFGRRFKACG